MPPARRPYNGAERKLVLAFDIGTTFSGISYSILEPGIIPEIQSVAQYPGLEAVQHDAKIPTILYYDEAGAVRAAGAEALSERVEEEAEDEGWMKAEWFKLHMHPKSISNSSEIHNLPELPRNKSVVDLFADFMKYLLHCAKLDIEATYPDGGALWEAMQPTIEYVLTHPNGWEGSQQQQMRRATVLAGLIPDDSSGHERVKFVTEGEASLHFCIQKGLTTEPMKNGEGILIVDAGGSTIDISAYGQSSEKKFEEIVAAECYLQGSVFVTERARRFLKDYLKESKFVDDVERMAVNFDQSAKLTCDKSDNPLFIKFGGIRDQDPSLGIRNGQLKLPSASVDDFFQPSIDCTVNAIQAIIKGQGDNPKKPIKTVFLVGGFAASPYLFAQVKAALEVDGVNVCKPKCYLNKAVAEGAVSFYIDHFVNVRIAKFAYGIRCRRLFDESNPSHCERASKVYTEVNGRKMIPGAFSTILAKGTQVSETQEYRHQYTHFSPERYPLKSIRTKLYVYRGSSTDPRWMDIDQDQYSILCHVEADTSQLSQSLTPRLVDSRMFFEMDFEVILSLGLTELAAQIAWKVDGIEQRGAAKVVYDDQD